MQKLILYALLVLIPTSALGWIGTTYKRTTAATISPLESKLRGFLDANNLQGFVRWLAQDDVDINAVVGKHKDSLLHLTARSGKVLFVDRLLKAGAEVDIGNIFSITPRDDAEFWGRYAVIVRLQEAGAMSVAQAMKEGEADEKLRIRCRVHGHLMHNVLPQFKHRINFLTVCGDWFARHVAQASLFMTQDKRELLVRPFPGGRTRLQEAVAQGKLNIAKQLLFVGKYQGMLSERDDHGWQAVHYAAFHGNSEALALLHEKGADINAVVSASQHTPLTLAALLGHTEVVQQLLEIGANPAQHNHLGMDALQLAVLGMYTETVQVLLQHGLPTHAIEAARQLATEINSTRQDYEELLTLLDEAPIRASAALNGQGLTALQQAVRVGDVSQVEAVLAQDPASVHDPDSEGWTVAHYAASLGDTTLMKWFYHAGADFKAVGPNGFTPALLAAQQGHVAAVSFLLKIDADVGVTTPEGENLLHLAVLGGHVHLVRWLVYKGVNLRLRTKAGESALDIAKRLGNKKIINSLDHIEIGFYEKSGEFYLGPADQG